MNLFPRKKTRKRKLLSSTEINAVSANNAHKREEQWKQTTNTMKIVIIVTVIAAIPILFIAWCIATYYVSPGKLPDNIYLGITSIVSFILGKSGIINALFKDKD